MSTTSVLRLFGSPGPLAPSASSGRRLAPAVLALALACLSAGSARAEESNAPAEAAKHFARGVALYGEADYRGAVVEFGRAYATVPNVVALYNLGEAQYQLQDYASALATFERYLAEASPNESRRAEVEGDVEVLHARVGHLSIKTTPPGADVTLDDRAIGRTPLEPVLVSTGRRKVIASLPGHPPVARYVDVAAGDEAAVVLELAGSDALDPAAAPPPPPPAPVTGSEAAAAPASAGHPLRALGWVATGIAGAGAITYGVLALHASSDLANDRNAYPTTPATLGHDANLVTTYSIVADSLTAAAVIVGGITLYATVASPRPGFPRDRTETGSTARLSLGPGSAIFDMTF